MSSRTETFFAIEKFPNALKHAIVGGYAKAALALLAWHTHKDVVYADLFAGSGKYDDGNPGSPLIVAEMSAKRQATGTSPRVLCFNVEANSGRYAALVANTSHIPAELITNLRGSWTKHLPDLLARIAGRPALIFLDPFGFRGIELSKMTSILAGIGADAWELIIMFNVRGLQRMAAAAAAEEAKGKSHRYYVLPNEVFGTDEWQKLLVNKLLPDEQFEAVAALYQRRLIETGAAQFRVVMSIGIPEAVDGKRAYYLMFVTRSEKAMTMISDEVNLQFERARVEAEDIEATKPLQISLFGNPKAPQTQAERDKSTFDALYYLVASSVTEHGPVEFHDLHVICARQMFTRFRERHLRAVLVRLRAEERVTTDRPRIDDGTVISWAPS